MSSTGNAQVGEDDLEEEAPGLWTSFATALRLIVGWFCIAIGVVNLLVETDSSEPDTAYFAFHVMIFIGGTLLLSVSLLPRGPSIAAYVTGAVTLIAGMVVSGVPVSSQVCCMTAFDVRHGWPFTFVARDDGAGEAARWHIDSQHLLADLLFWGYAGLILLVILTLVQRTPAGDPQPLGAPPTGSTHAEQRAVALGAEDGDVESRPMPQRTDGT